MLWWLSSIRIPKSNGSQVIKRWLRSVRIFTGTLREKILTDLEPFYAEHLGLYITQKCLENPDIPPMIYCKVNHCIWQDGKWIPLELAAATQPTEKNT